MSGLGFGGRGGGGLGFKVIDNDSKFRVYGLVFGGSRVQAQGFGFKTS